MSKAFPILSMNSWVVLSVSLSDDQACVDIVQGSLLRIFMRGCSGQGPPYLVPACLFELTSLCLCKLNKFMACQCLCVCVYVCVCACACTCVYMCVRVYDIWCMCILYSCIHNYMNNTSSVFS